MSKENSVTLDKALEIAKQYHINGNLAMADRTYRDILAVMPENFTSLYQLSIITYQQQRAKEGLQFIEKAIEIEPEKAEAWNAYGAMLEQIGERKKAIEKWKKALKLDSKMAAAYSNLASCYWSLKEYKKAKSSAEKAVELNPDNADGYVNYGVAVNSLGDIEQAVQLWMKALELNPQHPNALINLGNAMRDLGKLKESEEYSKKALELLPDNTIAMVNLANALLDQSFVKEAEDLYRKAIRLQPNYVDAHNNLSLVMMQQARYDDAAAEARVSLAFDPDNLKALGNLSVSLREMNQFKEAENAARKALTLQPDSAEARIDLADILYLSDRLDEAEILFNEASEIMPEAPRLYIKLAAVQEHLNRFNDALATLNKAKELSPDMPEIYYREGLIHLMSNNIDESLASYDKALEINPNFVQAIASKSETLQTKGDMEQAREIIKRGLAIDDSLPALYYTLSKVKKFTAEDKELKRMIEIADRSERLGHAQATVIHFALFKAYEDIKDYDNAFKHLKIANDRKRSGIPFDRDAQKKNYKAIVETYTPDFLNKFKGKGCDSNIPVFIVGMPRSGTTLTEQIISSHPDVFGAGELFYLTEAENKHGFINANNIKELGQSYVEMTQSIHPDAKNAKRITDKMPGNYMRLGQIIGSLPNAKIIHCKRNPMDTMLSCYKQLFARGQYWSYNFEDMAEHYALYEKMMEHWRNKFPDRFIEIDYEETVSNFEEQARLLIDHVGLEWNDACLSPHKQERSILTASKGQVRKPIYKSSVEAWRRYEEQMLPLQDMLEKYRKMPL